MNDKQVKIELNNRYYNRIRYDGELGKFCPDCNCRVGEYHALGCVNEECPRCTEKLQECKCE